MTATTEPSLLRARRVAQLCDVWNTASSVEPVEKVTCRTGIILDPVDAYPRFCFVSRGSPLEQVLGDSSNVLDRAGTPLNLDQLAERLLAGEVSVVVTSGHDARPPRAVRLPGELIAARASIRRKNVRARFLLRQIGLEEVSSHRGAPVQLYDDIAALWCRDLALSNDPAMLLTLGADRQRYVDAMYTERATDRLPRALGRLHDLGVRSHPRLVIV